MIRRICGGSFFCAPGNTPPMRKRLSKKGRGKYLVIKSKSIFEKEGIFGKNAANMKNEWE
ncbi:MAG: hypothetical protein IKI39_08485 [Oscillospiraceae bacterium]|nr:hypothetical protein [Oscillospiraceae bacterium]